MEQKSYKQLFEDQLVELHEKKGISLKKISEKSGVKYDRILQIRKGKSSGRLEDVIKIEKAYPELKNTEVIAGPDHPFIKTLLTEIADLKSMIQEMTIEQRAKFEQMVDSKLGEQMKEIREIINSKNK